MGEIEAGHGKSAGIVGIITLCFALVDVIVGFVWVSYGGGDASGLWCGLLLIITGILGIIAWVKLNKMAMVFFLVFCILDIICTIVQAVIAALAFLIWQILKAVIASQCTVKNGKCDCGSKSVPMKLEDCSWISDIEAIFLTLLIANGLCMIVVFAGSIIGCMATCCAKSQQQPGVVVVQQPGVTVTSHYPAQNYGPGAVQTGYIGPAGQPVQPASHPGQAPPVYDGQAQNPTEHIPIKEIPPAPDAAQ